MSTMEKVNVEMTNLQTLLDSQNSGSLGLRDLGLTYPTSPIGVGFAKRFVLSLPRSVFGVK